MEENIKVSIIMPVYKVEEYVGKAIESIQAQTLKEWEFLIVDDGTPDRSGEICDEYAAKDSRIHVIHKENGGAPSARNMANEIAKGEYMYFLDSDDWAEPTMLEDMYNLAKRDNAQLVVAGFYIDTYIGNGQYMTDDYLVPDAVYPNKEEFRKNAYKLFDKNLLYTPWNKLFEAKYVMEHNLRFPTTFWDDFPFNLAVFRDIERVGVTERAYYHFIRARAESETARYRADMYEKREEENGWMIELYDHWQVNDPASREMIARRYAERVVGCVENVANPACPKTRRQKMQIVREILDNPALREALAVARPRSAMMRALLFSLKTGCAPLVLCEGAFISFVKRRCTRLFARLKARR